jgi:RNA-dependent RNA polymerase
MLCLYSLLDGRDGCGYINKHALIALFHHFTWRTFPVAIQIRLGGNKVSIFHVSLQATGLHMIQGVLLLHPTDTSDWPRVWIRPSQTKIHFPQPPDPANVIIDILRPSYIRTPARLSPETIINLAHNGVPSTYFVNLLKSSVDEFFASFTD